MMWFDTIVSIHFRHDVICFKLGLTKWQRKWRSNSLDGLCEFAVKNFFLFRREKMDWFLRERIIYRKVTFKIITSLSANPMKKLFNVRKKWKKKWFYLTHLYYHLHMPFYDAILHSIHYTYYEPCNKFSHI